MRRLPLAVALLAAAACTNAGSDRILSVKATGTVSGIVYFDADGSTTLTAGDDSLKDVRVQLVAASDTTHVIASALSAASGFYRFSGMAVGSYAILVDPSTVGDSLRVVKVDSATATLLPGESLLVNVGLGFPALSIAAARALPAGRTVFLTGVALNASTAFEDTVVHLQDTSAAIRMTRLRSFVRAGDSVRVRGTTARRDDLPTFDDVRVVPLGTGQLPAPVELTVAAAGSAAGGTRDAALAEVRHVRVLYTAAGTVTTTMMVTDGTDTLEVLLDGNADASFRPGQLGADYIPGNQFDIVGVLQPKSTGVWRLKPRSAADLTLIPLPVISIAAARSLPAGQLVVVVGIALNNPSTFSDTTVHLADNTAAIRLTRLRGFMSAGDSVRVRATTASRSGQPTLDDVTSSSLGRGLSPAAASLTTAAAATASGGTKDAALAIVRGATVSDTATVVEGFRLHVTDGSGSLEVLLDKAAGFFVPGVFVPANKFDIVGVLVPTGSGTWRLKPRGASDLTKQ